MSESNGSSILGGIVALFITFYMIYTPVYFLFLNDETDAVQEASYTNMLTEILNISKFEDGAPPLEMKKIERAAEMAEEIAEEKLGVDISRSFEKALSKNKDISKVKYNSTEIVNNSRELLVAVNVSFKHATQGAVDAMFVVKGRTFFKPGLAHFASLMRVTVNGREVNAKAFIGEHVYGLPSDAVYELISLF